LLWKNRTSEDAAVSETALLAVGVARRTFTGVCPFVALTVMHIDVMHFECEWGDTLAAPPLFTYCKDMKGIVKLETSGMRGGLRITQDYRQHGSV